MRRDLPSTSRPASPLARSPGGAAALAQELFPSRSRAACAARSCLPSFCPIIKRGPLTAPADPLRRHGVGGAQQRDVYLGFTVGKLEGTS